MELWCCFVDAAVAVVAEHWFGFQQQRLEEELWSVVEAIAAVAVVVVASVVSVVAAAAVVGVVVVAVVVLDALLPLVVEGASKGLKIHYSGKEIVAVAAVVGVVVVVDLEKKIGYSIMNSKSKLGSFLKTITFLLMLLLLGLLWQDRHVLTRCLGG